MDLNYFFGKKKNVNYVKAFKSRRRMSKNNGYNVVPMGLLVESIFFKSNFFQHLKCGVEFLFIFWFGGRGEGGGM